MCVNPDFTESLQVFVFAVIAPRRPVWDPTFSALRGSDNRQYLGINANYLHIDAADPVRAEQDAKSDTAELTSASNKQRRLVSSSRDSAGLKVQCWVFSDCCIYPMSFINVLKAAQQGLCFMSIF